MRLITALVVLATLAFAGVSQAHQQKESYTTVLFNQRSGNLEVAHRFYIHDAEHALAKAIGKKADLSRDAESQQAFAAYITRLFLIKDGKDNPLALTVVGHEPEGKYFWVYQEAPLPDAVTALKVQAKALQEIWPKQINQVNVERDGITRSARLGSDDWKTIYLEAQQ